MIGNRTYQQGNEFSMKSLLARSAVELERLNYAFTQNDFTPNLILPSYTSSLARTLIERFCERRSYAHRCLAVELFLNPEARPSRFSFNFSHSAFQVIPNETLSEIEAIMRDLYKTFDVIIASHVHAVSSVLDSLITELYATYHRGRLTFSFRVGLPRLDLQHASYEVKLYQGQDLVLIQEISLDFIRANLIGTYGSIHEDFGLTTFAKELMRALENNAKRAEYERKMVRRRVEKSNESTKAGEM